MSSSVDVGSCEQRKPSGERVYRPHSAAGYTAERVLSNKPPASGKIKERRVKSAIESRREQEASTIFPEVPSGKLDPDWGVTKYSEDYGPKKRVSPAPIRPASPTRMNNPHPAKARHARCTC